MRESIKKYFKIGLVHFMAYPSELRGLDERIADRIKKTAQDDYFDAVEITWIKDGALRAKVSQTLSHAHMEVCYGAQPRLLTAGLNPNDLDEAGRMAAQAALMEAVDEAHELGAKGIAFLSGAWSEENKDAAYAQLLKTTLNVCGYAKTKGMSVELEVFDFDIAKKALIGPAPYAAKFAADVRSRCDNFGLLLDLSHIPMTRETSRFAVRAMRPYITHLHIGNSVCSDESAEGYGDEHQRFGFPGGSNDVAQILDFLRAIKLEGLMDALNPVVLSFEVKPWAGEESDVVIANAKRALNRAWALLED